MKLTTIITSLALSSCLSCSTPAQTSDTSPPTKQDTTWRARSSSDKDTKRKAMAQNCPRDIELSAYIDLMPGPPMGNKPRTARILLTVIDGTGWAVGTGHPVAAGETTMTLNIFRATNHVKPPARSLKPRRINGEKAFTELRFGAPTPDIKRVEVTCFGEVIAETTVYAVY